MSEDEQFTLRWRGRETGPFPLSEINRQLDEHEIGMGHEIFFRGDWITLDAFFAALQGGSAPPQTPNASIEVAATTPKAKPAHPPADSDARPRRRLVFAFLAIVGGFLGLHNFYARQWLTGLLQLLLTVATYLMGFGIIAAWIWAAVEAVVVRKDGNGIDMI